MINYSIILVKTSLSANIGAVARVMLNFSCVDLRLVNPTENWNDDKAKAVATKAAMLLEEAKVFKTLEDAASDLNTLYALSARPRFLNKPLLDVKEINNYIEESSNKRVGLVFGPENSGLSNEDLSLTNKIFQVSTNKEFSSLNLAQAVAITLFQLSKNNINYERNIKSSKEATKGELQLFFDHLQNSLEKTHFFQEQSKKASMMCNIKNIFSRIENLTSQEVNTLRGIISELTKKIDK